MLAALTAEGAQSASEVSARLGIGLATTSEAVTTLAADEQTTLLRALMKMIRTLQELGQIPVQRMCVSCTHFRPHVHDGDQPHHCAFVDAPLGPSALRLYCRDHAAATPERQQVHWARRERAAASTTLVPFRDHFLLVVP